MFLRLCLSSSKDLVPLEMKPRDFTGAVEKYICSCSQLTRATFRELAGLEDHQIWSSRSIFFSLGNLCVWLKNKLIPRNMGLVLTSGISLANWTAWHLLGKSMCKIEQSFSQWEMWRQIIFYLQANLKCFNEAIIEIKLSC